MSRIHEALKRAEQERINQASQSQPAANNKTVAAPPVVDEVHSVLADQAAERNIDAGDRKPAILESTLRPESAPRLHGQQFIRFDDIWQASAAPGWRVDSQISVFADPATAPLAAEQFRTLRSRLYQIRDRRPLKSVLITSALAAEGKTFVAVNLAQSLACQQGCKVLLIDGDLRAPGLHIALGAPLAPGLSDYLR